MKTIPRNARGNFDKTRKLEKKYHWITKQQLWGFFWATFLKSSKRNYQSNSESEYRLDFWKATKIWKNDPNFE